MRHGQGFTGESDEPVDSDNAGDPAPKITKQRSQGKLHIIRCFVWRSQWRIVFSFSIWAHTGLKLVHRMIPTPRTEINLDETSSSEARHGKKIVTRARALSDSIISVTSLEFVDRSVLRPGPGIDLFFSCKERSGCSFILDLDLEGRRTRT